MSLGLLGALLAALGYGTATILQAIGVRRVMGRADAPWPRRLWAGRLYGAGLLLDLLAFLASVLALRTLPLFVVESAIAGSVAVTAVLSAIVLHLPLSRRESLALAVTGLGLVALAISAGEGPAIQPPGIGAIILAGAVVVIAVLLAGWRMPRDSKLSLALLSAAAGLSFAGVGVAARVLEVPDPWWTGWHDPLVIGLVVHGILAMVAFTIGIERGSATTVAAVTFTVETVVPAAIGLRWLGDTVRPGPGWVVVAAIGFAAALGGSLALAAFAEPELD